MSPGWNLVSMTLVTLFHAFVGDRPSRVLLLASLSMKKVRALTRSMPVRKTEVITRKRLTRVGVCMALTADPSIVCARNCQLSML